MLVASNMHGSRLLVCNLVLALLGEPASCYSQNAASQDDIGQLAAIPPQVVPEPYCPGHILPRLQGVNPLHGLPKALRYLIQSFCV